MRRNNIRLCVLTIAAILTTACTPTAIPDADPAAVIQSMDEQWSAAAAKNDLEGTIALYSDDAVLLRPTRRSQITEIDSRILGSASRPKHIRIVEGIQNRGCKVW